MTGIDTNPILFTTYHCQTSQQRPSAGPFRSDSQIFFVHLRNKFV
ncbi:hypothetical protein DDI_2418 [Dickeya dianthicola RNS04.9]|nr:hypothetical protein DDI_2418 [Dickeya dianthicola RNS04.9]